MHKDTHTHLTHTHKETHSHLIHISTHTNLSDCLRSKLHSSTYWSSVHNPHWYCCFAKGGLFTFTCLFNMHTHIHTEISWTLTVWDMCAYTPAYPTETIPTLRHSCWIKLERAVFFRCTLCMHIRTHTPHWLRWFMSVRLRFAWFILLKLHCAPEGLDSPLHSLHGGLLVTEERKKGCAWACAFAWSWRFVSVHTVAV